MWPRVECSNEQIAPLAEQNMLQSPLSLGQYNPLVLNDLGVKSLFNIVTVNIVLYIIHAVLRTTYIYIYPLVIH